MPTYDYIPDVESVSFAPNRIDPGGGLGVRGSVTISIRDHAMTDAGLDPYFRTRSWYPIANGTYWGRLIARNPFFEGATIRVKTGFLASPNDTDANFESRTYVIDRIEGPTKDNKVRIVAKDVLKLADNKRAQAPAPSTGKLLSDITAGASSLTLTPTGVGDDEYPASGTIRVGEEIMTFTRSADVLTLVRGTDGTSAVEHDAGETAQLCYRVSGQRVDLIIADLLENYAGVDPSFLPTVDWDVEAAAWLPDHILSTLIIEPTGVSDLITELCQQCLCYLWWDERDQEIKFRAVRPLFGDAAVTIDDDANILADSASASRDPNDRVSRVIVLYDRIDPREALDKPSNYRRQQVSIDTDAESAFEYGSPRVRTFYSRWLTADNDGQAISLAGRLLNKYRDPPVRLKMSLDAKDSGLWTGDIALVTCDQIQDTDGTPKQTYMQVLQVSERQNGTVYEYELMDSGFSGRYCFVTVDGMVDYSAASDAQKQVNGFICQDDGLFADGTKGYKII